jgi:hypothetical protein
MPLQVDKEIVSESRIGHVGIVLCRSVVRIPGTDGEVLVHLRHRLHGTIWEILGSIPEMTNVGL